MSAQAEGHRTSRIDGSSHPEFDRSDVRSSRMHQLGTRGNDKSYAGPLRMLRANGPASPLRYHRARQGASRTGMAGVRTVTSARRSAIAIALLAPSTFGFSANVTAQVLQEPPRRIISCATTTSRTTRRTPLGRTISGRRSSSSRSTVSRRQATSTSAASFASASSISAILSSV
jgi:hypothetical protein